MGDRCIISGEVMILLGSAHALLAINFHDYGDKR
jgi:hypothetical protein